MKKTAKDILTTAQVCERLRLSRPVVTKMAREGRIPALKTSSGRNSRWLFYWPAVVKALGQRETSSD